MIFYLVYHVYIYIYIHVYMIYPYSIIVIYIYTHCSVIVIHSAHHVSASGLDLQRRHMAARMKPS